MSSTTTLPPRPQIPEVITPESVADYKAALRRWDEEALASGLITPTELRRQNSFLGQSRRIRYVNLEADVERIYGPQRTAT